VLPGVTVTMKSPQVLGQFHRRDRPAGRLPHPQSRAPAAYEARAELQGFQTVLQQVAVRVASTLAVDFTPGGWRDERKTVNVSAETPIVDPERSGLSINISNEALDAGADQHAAPLSGCLGARARRVRCVRISRTSIRASTSRGTSENSTKLGRHGRHRSVRRRRLLRQLQLRRRHSRHPDQDARRGGRKTAAATGGFMSIVTKSGGNDVHGSAAFFVIPQAFNSSNVDGVPPKPAQNRCSRTSHWEDRSSGIACGCSAPIAGSRKIRR